MSKVIILSTQFPAYHPRKGEATHFVEQFYNSIYGHMLGVKLPKGLTINHDIKEIKNHTIRAGHRFKAGDWFSPRIWSGRPYASKQIILDPDVLVQKTWDVEIDALDVWSMALPSQQQKYLTHSQEARIAKNDGLSEEDLYWWFKYTKKPWQGQIICWNSKVEY